MEQFGYEFGRFIQPKTLEQLIRLHQIVLETKHIHIAQLDDQLLRKILIESGIRIGPINSSLNISFDSPVFFLLRR